ncbi:hypothetical protein ma498 [Moumouvirus australiensis]|uniref:Uncharacterized protein n=1 Tax=Moumouvirus australiensis TaxID=2109587 RepID=A0A2P1ELW9_9VIRU|nr:hypothetical protein QKC55_gp407 [Moumouvirus australiensis]AVL94884.1 hypothetical protein ma498 [Moumouvirus australiensis]
MENTIIKPINYINYIVYECISKVYLHPVQLNLIYNEITEDNFDYNAFCDNCEHEDEKNIKEEFDIIKCVKLSTLLSDINLKKLTGYSKLNGNDDCRGGGCGNYDIPVSDFKYTIINDNGITIRDLLEIVYRLKGSKYDFWYELFGSINIKKQTDNYIKFKVDFDYGS